MKGKALERRGSNMLDLLKQQIRTDEKRECLYFAGGAHISEHVAGFGAWQLSSLAKAVT